MTQLPERLYSNTEAARMMGVEPRALEQLRNRGGGPIVTYVGRHPRYSRKHINAYLASRVKVPARAAR